MLSAVPESFRIFQWHADTFTLPPGAAHLAQGAVAAYQAFRTAPRVYGTQFHFEANRAVVARWSEQFSEAAEAMSPGWAAAHSDHAAKHGPGADAAGLALARAWVRLI